jgi:predicted cupin superfamily sugar epimerase
MRQEASIDNAAEIIRLLDLKPHPEGGFYRETFRDSAQDEAGRSASTLIYFLLAEGQTSHWHRVDAVESWHFYAGAPLAISVSQTGEDVDRHVLGNDLLKGQRPQFVVPAHCWQSATSLGAWTLVGCSVAPGFEFAHFETAPRDWLPASLRE